MEQVRAIDKQLRAADPSKPLPEDATWATDGFRTRFDAAAADFTEAGAVFTGKITTESIVMRASSGTILRVRGERRGEPPLIAL